MEVAMAAAVKAAAMAAATEAVDQELCSSTGDTCPHAKYHS